MLKSLQNHPKMKNDSLNPSRLSKLITRSPEFQAALPRRNLDDMSPVERRQTTRRSVALGSAALSLRLEKEHGTYHIDTQLTALISQLDNFYFSQKRIDEYRERTRDIPRGDIHKKDWQRHQYDKRKVTEFNHTLHEVINASRGQFNFHELLTFMTNQHIALGGSTTQEEFHGMARDALVGMRNEMAVEQVLLASGVKFEGGTIEQDSHGGDIIIEDIPLDLKASTYATKSAKESARKHGKNPDLIIWSHIYPEDYRGELVLPAKHNQRIASELLPDIHQAIASEKRRQHHPQAHQYRRRA